MNELTTNVFVEQAALGFARVQNFTLEYEDYILFTCCIMLCYE